MSNIPIINILASKILANNTVGVKITASGVVSNKKVHIALLIDTSGSMEGERITAVIKTIKVLIERLNVETSFACFLAYGPVVSGIVTSRATSSLPCAQKKLSPLLMWTAEPALTLTLLSISLPMISKLADPDLTKIKVSQPVEPLGEAFPVR